ncbi:MAG: HAMP domain-containing histidine kinase [Thiotrichales bacterium]|nr:HAMP domain-containing histidine kinase [Thiotrichales bacterium]
MTVARATTPQAYYYSALLGFLLLLWGATLIWFDQALHIFFPLQAVLSLMTLMLATLWLVARVLPFSRWELRPKLCQGVWFALLSWLLLLNGLLLYYTGGKVNPLMPLLLAPLILGMLILSTAWFMSLAALAGLAYLSLNQFYVPIMSLQVQSLQAFFAWYLQGALLAYILIIMLLALLVFPLRKRLEMQRAALAKQHAQALQTESLLALASLATASVHRLSTPLNSLTLLHELLAAELHSPQGKNYLLTAKQQLQLCIDALQTLRWQAQNLNHSTAEGQDLTDFLTALRQEFALRHPHSELQLKTANLPASTRLRLDGAFKLALMNLLDNAARHSPHYVCLELEISAHACQWRIRDLGGGLANQNLQTLGEELAEPYHGMGLGILLSRMIIERYQGRLTFSNWQTPNGKGLVAEIDLPASCLIRNQNTSEKE